jgi:hypothetical protein
MRKIFFYSVWCVLAACSKSDNISAIAHIRVLQAIPDAALNVSINPGNIILGNALAYDSMTNYIEMNAGTLRLVITNAADNTQLLNALFNVKAGNNYTFIFSDSLKKFKITILKDLPLFTDSTTTLRFLHLSSTTGTVYFRDSTDTINVSYARYFNDQYSNNTAAKYTDTLKAGIFPLKVFKSDTNVLITSVPPYNYLAAKSYTLVLHNARAASGDDSAAVTIFSDQ